jgi:colicin import membrane protein
MHAADADDRLAFAPPPQPGLLRALALAVLAHLLLVLALMHGLQWKRETQNAAAEAELWSALPQEAAPRATVPPPPPPPPPAPVVKAPPLPEPPVVKVPEPPAQRDADIAVEREKQKRALEKKKLAEERAREKKLLAQERELEKKKLAQQERDQRKLEAQNKREEDLAKKQQQAKLAAAEARRKEDDQRRKQEQETSKLAQLREDNLRRMQGLAGSGAPSSSGGSAQASGPSAGWGARVQARVRPNIVYTDDSPGNPKAEVEVRTSPDGTIVAKRLVRSSGVKAWDEAVLRALDKTEVLPRDIDGRVPSPVVITFRPHG